MHALLSLYKLQVIYEIKHKGKYRGLWLNRLKKKKEIEKKKGCFIPQQYNWCMFSV